ncbi:GH3 auxin-responsive promoter family protein [Streptomyces johnsoniae]|uniref:GH3 auxin-responsive promoter family protein n=1 Tax=Streptomyces johnsoniae TaxID=3075532 RepID=A0ABU2S8Z2_9ACTN|nr:GH3 auxin-responsive promoter family protein [Streptomyces sp. DSM 41886]MDT0445420.1 GH3 auxin-responsive promoter family protein [Streptomyces sp. DSM 41886]
MTEDAFVQRTLAAHRVQRQWCREPHRVSRQVFADLMGQARDTAFGRDHRLGRVRTPDDFKAAVPVGGYESFRGYVERIREGELKVLTESRPYALHTTSGTTGKPKYIPTTRHWRNHYRGPALYAQWGLYFQRLGLEHYRPGDVLDMSWERCVIEHLPGPDDTVPVYSITKRPSTVGPRDWTPPWYGEPWFLDDTGELSLYTKLRLLADSDVRIVVAVNPSRITALGGLLNEELETLLKDLHDGTLRGHPSPQLAPARDTAYRLEAAHFFGGRVTLVDLWPRLSLQVCWNSASARYYRGWLERLAPGVPLMPFSTTGTEGIVTMPVDSHPSAGPLAIDQGLFEFVPCEPGDPGKPLPPDVATLDPDELVNGGTYRLVMSQANGLYRYDSGDIYRVVGRVGRLPRLEFEGRGGSVSSFTGEKLTESDVHAAIRAAVGHASVPNVYCVVPSWGHPPGYVLVMEWPDGPGAASDAFRDRVDAELCRVNIEYAEKRGSGRLAPIRDRAVPPGTFRALAESQVARGTSAAQVKHRWLHTDDNLLNALSQRTRTA